VVIQHDPKNAEKSKQDDRTVENTLSLKKTMSLPYSPSRNEAPKPSLSPGLLLRMAMVARGEISLLIVEIGYNNTSYVSSNGFITAV
jgi:hypothetical protein